MTDKDKDVYVRRIVSALHQHEALLGRACVAALAHGPAAEMTEVSQLRSAIASLVQLSEVADQYALLLEQVRAALEKNGVS